MIEGSPQFLRAHAKLSKTFGEYFHLPKGIITTNKDLNLSLVLLNYYTG
jgi:hypothetical protein